MLWGAFVGLGQFRQLDKALKHELGPGSVETHSPDSVGRSGDSVHCTAPHGHVACDWISRHPPPLAFSLARCNSQIPLLLPVPLLTISSESDNWPLTWMCGLASVWRSEQEAWSRIETLSSDHVAVDVFDSSSVFFRSLVREVQIWPEMHYVSRVYRNFKRVKVGRLLVELRPADATGRKAVAAYGPSDYQFCVYFGLWKPLEHNLCQKS